MHETQSNSVAFPWLSIAMASICLGMGLYLIVQLAVENTQVEVEVTSEDSESDD